MKVLRTTFRRLMQDLDVEELRSGFFDTYVALMEHLAQISPTLDCWCPAIVPYFPPLSTLLSTVRCERCPFLKRLCSWSMILVV